MLPHQVGESLTPNANFEAAREKPRKGRLGYERVSSACSKYRLNIDLLAY